MGHAVGLGQVPGLSQVDISGQTQARWAVAQVGTPSISSMGLGQERVGQDPEQSLVSSQDVPGEKEWWCGAGWRGISLVSSLCLSRCRAAHVLCPRAQFPPDWLGAAPSLFIFSA